MYFCDQRGWGEAWLSQPGVEEYHYQNQTDQPEELTNRQWNARRDAWDKALGDRAVPAMAGFTINVSDPFGPNIWKLMDERRARSNTVNQAV